MLSINSFSISKERAVASHFYQFVGQASRLSVGMAQVRCLHYGDFCQVGMYVRPNVGIFQCPFSFLIFILLEQV